MLRHLEINGLSLLKKAAASRKFSVLSVRLSSVGV